MEEKNKPYQLNRGYLLDGRYEIGSVLGEGGFGITYAGTNVRIGREVAIKEFFCMDYMGRDDDGVSVVLTDKGARRRFNTEKARFMREARILGEFKDDPGVVTVLDYFEAGGTAYLVMDYLKGDTLHDHVKDRGAYDPKTFFEEIRPLMHTLAKVHEAGVIHRDISPDNIMRGEDGSVVLIDFGSAKDLSGKTVTTATTYKDGFAPPEQYSSGKKLGPETDIYALAATFYYCLTGVRPESAIQRVMYDELRPLHELAGGIPEDIEQMIAKGMALSTTDRFRTVTEMEDIIDAHYPLLTPEEKERIRRQKKMRRICLAAAGVLLLAVLSVHFVRNSTLYKMRMQDTQVVHLEWHSDEETLEREKDGAEEIIRNRLEVLAGKNNYLWNSDSEENTVSIEIPESVLCENEPADLFRKYVTRTISDFEITHADREGNPEYFDESVEGYPDLPTENIAKKDIEEAEAGEGLVPTGPDTAAYFPYVRISIKDPSPEMSEEFLEEEGQLLSFVIVEDAAENANVPCFAAGDGKTLYLIPQESVDKEEFSEVLQNAYMGDSSVTPELSPVEGERFREALAYDLTHKSAGIVPGVIAEPSVKWETPDSILAGENQVSESEISGEAILAEWRYDDFEDISESGWVNATVAMRKRLDALGVPYAFGVAPYDKKRISLKLAEKDISQAELLMLENATYLYISSDEDYETMYDGKLVKVGTGDDEHIEIRSDSSSDQDSMKELIDTARKKNVKSLKVSLGYDGAYPVGSINVSEIDDAYLNKGRLPLAEFGIGGNSDKEAWDRLLRYVNAILTEQSEASYAPDRAALYDAKGRYKDTVAFADIDGGFYPECLELASEMNEEIRSAAEYHPGYEVEVYVEDGGFRMTVYDGSLTAENFEEEAVKRAEYLFTKYDLGGNEVEATLKLSNGLEAGPSGREVPNEMAVLYFGHISKYSEGEMAGKYGLYDGCHVQVIKDDKVDSEEGEKMTAVLNELIRESDVFGKIIG